MMKIVNMFLGILFFGSVSLAQNKNDQHLLFTQILNDYVHDGLVNYINLKEDKRLDKYLEQLENTNPDNLRTDEDKLAFWINAYNAFTLKFIIEEYPVESINDLHWGGLYLGTLLGTTVWDDEKIIINGTKLSLNNIEHDIARKKFNEERVHFAMVCASYSCPQLRDEAYEGFKLNKQLNEQARLFFMDETKNNFDLKKRTAYLSKILNWYSSDFGNDDQSILLYVSQFLDREIANDIRRNSSQWEIDHLSYNWDLNEIK
ncbi:MAG: DUF547 domain-containing protein [Ignavibacteria bacterium]|nr:MAG: DUF547 domain-containing protein [Ignavibacteria bacterium]